MALANIRKLSHGVFEGIIVSHCVFIHVLTILYRDLLLRKHTNPAKGMTLQDRYVFMLTRVKSDKAWHMTIICLLMSVDAGTSIPSSAPVVQSNLSEDGSKIVRCSS